MLERCKTLFPFNPLTTLVSVGRQKVLFSRVATVLLIVSQFTAILIAKIVSYRSVTLLYDSRWLSHTNTDTTFFPKAIDYLLSGPVEGFKFTRTRGLKDISPRPVPSYQPLQKQSRFRT